jgi:copper chaperone CopZ
MNINRTLMMLLIASISITNCFGQIKNQKTDTVKIYGNCGMCKKTIEKAANIKNEAKVEWNVMTKMAVITYDSTKTTLDDILKRIANAGYDSDKFRAPAEVYRKLHKCCKYKRPKNQSEINQKVKFLQYRNHRYFYENTETE